MIGVSSRFSFREIKWLAALACPFYETPDKRLIADLAIHPFATWLLDVSDVLVSVIPWPNPTLPGDLLRY